MLRIDWSRWQSILLCLVLVVVLLFALGFALLQVSHTILLFLLAAVLALILLPIVDWGEAHGLRRWVAVVLTYLAGALLLVGGAMLLLAPLLSQLVDLARALPAYFDTLHQKLVLAAQALSASPLGGAIDIIETPALSAISAWSAQFVNLLVGALTGVGSGVTDLALTVVLSIYMLAGGRRIHGTMHRVIPSRYGDRFLFVTTALTQVMGGYIRGQVVLALLLGVAVTVGLYLLGMPYALLLGFLAMVLGVIPMIGSALSAIPALLVALTQPFPMVVWVLIFFIIVQNVQDQVLAPRIQGQSLGLHPLAVMFVLLAGAQVAGVVGAIFALPFAGFFWILFVAVYHSLQPDAADVAEAEVTAVAEPAVILDGQPVTHASSTPQAQ